MPNNTSGAHDDRSVPGLPPVDGGPDRARLREAAVLAHTVEGAGLVLTTTAGQVLTVGRGPADDLSPCDVRQALLVAATPGGPDCFRRATAVEVVGSLLDVGGGLYESRPGGTVERWFATCLRPDDVGSAVESCDLDVPDDAIVVSLVADDPLAASAVRIAATSPAGSLLLDEVSRWVAARCLVEEVLRLAHVGASDRDAGPRRA